MITEATQIIHNGKTYLACPNGAVRCTFIRNGNPVDRWYQADEKNAQRIFALACGN